MNKLILPVLVALFAGTGCTVRMIRDSPTDLPPPPPPRAPAPLPAPAPPPRVERMTQDEAVFLAVEHARSRGFHDIEVDKVQLTGNDVWKVKLEVERGDAEGKLHVDLDAWSRQVLRAQEHVKYRKDRKRKNKHARAHAASPVAAHHRGR
jgi:hypothetical protein